VSNFLRAFGASWQKQNPVILSKKIRVDSCQFGVNSSCLCALVANKKFNHLRRGLQKDLNIFEYFCTFPLIFRIFSNIFEYFRTFSNVFERFFLVYFPQTLQINLPNPIFTSKTNIPALKKTQKTAFLPKIRIISVPNFTSLRKIPTAQYEVSDTAAHPDYLGLIFTTQYQFQSV